MTLGKTVTHFAVMFFSSLYLSACVVLTGPTFTNAFGMHVEATLSYSDGRAEHHAWPACQIVAIGEENVQLERVRFEKDGRLLREFSAGEIRSMLEREDAEPHDATGWNISLAGARLISDDEPNPCRKD